MTLYQRWVKHAEGVSKRWEAKYGYVSPAAGYTIGAVIGAFVYVALVGLWRLVA